MTISIADVLMKVRRWSTLLTPSEITVVIPHCEIRRRFDKYGRKTEEELILDSITIVDAPRHEPLGGNPQPPSLPRTTWRYQLAGYEASPHAESRLHTRGEKLAST
jgi:hypothetical protein